jgi:hypothetical protein
VIPSGSRWRAEPVIDRTTLTTRHIAAVEDYAITVGDEHLKNDCGLARLGWVRPRERVAEDWNRTYGTRP